MEVDGSGNDGIRILCGNFLNVHTHLCRSDEDNTLGSTVIEHSDIVFMSGFAAFSKHDL